MLEKKDKKDHKIIDMIKMISISLLDLNKIKVPC